MYAQVGTAVSSSVGEVVWTVDKLTWLAGMPVRLAMMQGREVLMND